MSRRTEMLLKNMEFVGYNDLNKKPGFQMGMHRTEDILSIRRASGIMVLILLK